MALRANPEWVVERRARSLTHQRVTTAKIILFAAALACAAFNRLIAKPRGAWRRMARVIAGELALLFLILGAAVMLAQTEPYG